MNLCVCGDALHLSNAKRMIGDNDGDEMTKSK